MSAHVTPRRLYLSRRLVAVGLLALAGLLAFTLLAGPAEAAKRKGKRGVVVKTMTYNASLGSGLSARFATSLDEFCDKAGENIREVDATKPKLRMRAIARNILKSVG